jgi:TPR repeat protein
MPGFGEQNITAAESAIEAAIDEGVEDAKLELVKLRWFFMRETASEDKRADTYQLAQELRDRSDNGDALYFLALLTTHGFGTSASPEVGFDLQQQAADLGNTDAMFELYIHHENGLGTVCDQKLAFAACERAAKAGHHRAMYNLGAFNATGRGTPKDMQKAVEWYERAADAGNPSAMAGLAVIYATGDGVEADREYAEQLFDQADYCGLDVGELRAQVGL